MRRSPPVVERRRRSQRRQVKGSRFQVSRFRFPEGRRNVDLSARSDRLATGDGLGGDAVQIDSQVSSGRDLWAHVASKTSAVSVASNIAEGQGRNSTKEFVQFLGMAHGSLVELETQVLIARRLKYIEQPETDEIIKQVERVRRLINGLMQSFQKGKAAGSSS